MECFQITTSHPKTSVLIYRGYCRNANILNQAVYIMNDEM